MLEKFRGVNLSPDLGEDPRTMLTLQLAFSPVQLKQEGVVRVRMMRGDAEIPLGALRIRAQAPLPE
jgi:hypothetical protein